MPSKPSTIAAITTSTSESSKAKTKKPRLVLGLDGEGHTTKSGRHLYTYLAASSSDGTHFYDVENPRGLGTREILDFLLELPKGALIGGFALGYDFTKWVENLLPSELWHLYRPDEPREGDKEVGEHGPKPIRVNVDGELYSVNLVATKFSASGEWDRLARKFRTHVVVWDLFRFFQRAFVASLREWKVGTEAELAAIQKMKDRRGKFTSIGPKEKDYCRSEVRLLAALFERLIESCEEAGLVLRDFYGAGSLGAATLRDGPAKEQRVLKMPKAMRDAVSRAFFGGRFEDSVQGPVACVHGRDLASAYPYAETCLPCLACGSWKRVRGSHAKVEKAVRRARAACVRYRLTPRLDGVSTSFWEACGPEAAAAMPEVGSGARVSAAPWGPFPYRLEDGTILFPAESGGGWVWHYEALAALDHPEVWPNVELREAWVYTSRCKCPAPYLDEVSRFYIARLEWGKEGPGLCLKKGLASRYGKAAQTVGSAPFSCAVKAGLVTSHTRSECMRAIARDPRAALSIATDGIQLSRVVKLREPEETGTGAAAKKHGKSPLGAWEGKDPRGVFFIRPGMRFAIEPLTKKRWRPEKGDKGTTAARGVGVKRLHGRRAAILRAWERKPGSPVKIPRGTIFNGGKLSVTDTKAGCKKLTKYGRWTKADPFKVSYLPLPKRPARTRDFRLLTWALDPEDGESHPYDPIAHRLRPELVELRQAQEEAEAQPDLEELGVEDD